MHRAQNRFFRASNVQFNHAKTRSRTNCARRYKFSRVRRTSRTDCWPRVAWDSRRVGHRPVKGVEVARGSRFSRTNAAYGISALLKGSPRMRAPAKITTRRNDKNAPLSFSLFASDSDQRSTRVDRYCTRGDARRLLGNTQPGLLNPRIRHAYRNHSDYPTRITMQMLVNSHVPARSALPSSPTPRDCLVLKWCTRSSPPSMLIFPISHPSLRPLGSYSCAFRRKKKDTAEEGLEFVELHQSTELVSSSTYLGYLARNEKNEERLIGANAF